MIVVEDAVLSKCNNIRHGFFTRKSQPEAINFPILCGLQQIHSNRVRYLDRPWDKPPKGDAMVTTQKNIALSILTADCAPLLFADPENSVIAAAHAGWRGALDGIVENTLDMMCNRGAERAAIIAAIGPCIAQNNYQVSPEFRLNFISQDHNHDKYFIHQINEGKYLFDLKAYINFKLHAAGVNKISISPFDTYTDEVNFHSYRRATHRGEADYGRQISVIINL